DLLLRNAEHPARIAAEPALRRAWKPYGRSPDRVLAVPLGRTLVPEVTFTVENGFPDVITSRILIPPSGKEKE
ncbi:MAG: hypothetical protein M3Q75_15865, partial [Gemmatimonadota bacterium]|nr:hypothetical protein [Gemmatimonadota bacterium]